MSLRINLFRKRKERAAEAPQPACPHWELAPRWASAESIGIADRVTHYTCVNCGSSVSTAEAAARRLEKLPAQAYR